MINPVLALCFYVASVTSNANLAGIENEKFTFGVKQITEDLLLERGTIMCDPTMVKSAEGVTVVITDIKAPTQGIRVGPFEFKQKKTIVEIDITMEGKVYHGVGSANTNVAATLMQLQNETLAFERTEFSVALKKAIVDALD
jgi:hypothetical protein